MHTGQGLQVEVREQPRRLVLSFHYVHTGEWTQAIRLAASTFIPANPLTLSVKSDNQSQAFLYTLPYKA